MILHDIDFDEIPDIYGGFPLKENYLEAGNAALKKYGVKATVVNGAIRIPYLSRPYCDEEELDYYRDECLWEEKYVEEAKGWLLKADAIIRLETDPRKGITEADIECYAEGLGEDDDYSEDRITPEEYELALKIIIDFLDTAVDAE